MPRRRLVVMVALAVALAVPLVVALAGCVSEPVVPTRAVLSVSIDGSDVALAEGATRMLTASVEVTGGASTTVRWDSSDTNVATVSGGLVTAHAAGVATITATSIEDTSKRDSVLVTVTAGARGTIAGTVTVGTAAAPATRELQAVPLGAGHAPPGTLARQTASGFGEAAFVPGELIVRFESDVAGQALAPLAVGSIRLEALRALAVPGAALYRTPALDRADLAAMARALAARPDVRYVHPNYVLEPLRVPNDPLYARQWHYPAIELPAAWDITTGSPNTVVAVVDSGILHAPGDPARSHPDLTGKVLPGYDFISNPDVAGDGDGRDPDPYDVGDNPGGQSSYHGSHVAGTIAAATDNGIGVAGVDWSAMLLPVRALGIGGGTLVDVIDGTLWAAGFAVPGVPANANPAHVINLSLGSPRPCSLLEQEAFDRIAATSPRNAIVVVAAGNANVDAGSFAPASCRNVITVGATEARGHRAPYSNHGTRIDVMAPGGDLTVDRSGDGQPDGVLSLTRDDETGAFDYRYLQGTSMAAPHVAGVVSLMKGMDPGIGLPAALEALRATARPLTAAACSRPSGAHCGAGLIDAEAALVAVRDGTIPSPGIGDLVFEPATLDFGAFDSTLPLTLRNVGDVAVAWEIVNAVPAVENPGPMPDGSIQGGPLDGVVPAGGTQVVTIAIDRSLVLVDGAYAFALVFDVAGEEARVSASFVVGDTASPTLHGPMIVAAFVQDGGEWVESGFQVDEAFFSSFSFPVRAGDNLVIAWSDENDNRQIDEGDYLGVYPDLVGVAPGATVTGIDVALEPVVTIDTAPGAVKLPEDAVLGGVDWATVKAALEAAARSR